MFNIGYGNAVNSDRVIAVVKPDSAPVKRFVLNARDEEKAIDATQGRRTKSIIITDTGYAILSALVPETVSARINGSIVQGKEDNDEE